MWADAQAEFIGKKFFSLIFIYMYNISLTFLVRVCSLICSGSKYIITEILNIL